MFNKKRKERKTTVDSNFELMMLLNNRFHKRFELDWTGSFDGTITGHLDGEKFVINFIPHKYILLSTKTKNIVEELRPALTEAMDGIEPLISYDLVGHNPDINNSPVSSMEWNTIEPEKRLKEVINGEGVPASLSADNIQLYNGKSIADYKKVSNEEEKIYGIYNGGLNPEDIPNQEYELFMLIHSHANVICKVNDMKTFGLLEEVDLTDTQYALEYLIYQTTKYGVGIPAPVPGRHIELTPEFEAWYAFYKNHFDAMEEEVIEELSQAIERGEDVSEYLPQGNWRDTLEKPVERTMRPEGQE